ncbi:MAG: hypothetical protein Q4B48_04565 [Syntrophomonadaceae bacterium]|nr:hypothetical protein [Syntrophomonadaceae bacterium]
MKHSWWLATAYLGAVIGAGFASGQEIVQFFVCYGPQGQAGAVLATALFALAGAALMWLAGKKGFSHYQDVLRFTLGPRLGRLVDLLLAGFLFVGVSTMLSAAGAIFSEHFYLPAGRGVLLTFALVLVLLFRGYQGLMLAYGLLVPVKIALLMGISAWAAFFIDPAAVPAQYGGALMPDPQSWLPAALLYVAYNFALAMVILTEYQRPGKMRAGVAGAALGGLLLGVIVLINYAALSRFLPAVLHYEVPMLYVCGNISLTVKHVYCAVLWLGILTTALANAFGFAQRLSGHGFISYRAALIGGLVLSLPLALQSFSGLVGKIYPLFGLLGIIILTALFIKVIAEAAKSLRQKKLWKKAS